MSKKGFIFMHNTTRLLPLILVLYIFQLPVSLWASGKFEEKYYIALDNGENYFNLQLEKAFFEYARKNDITIEISHPNDNSLSGKIQNIKSALDNKFSVIIFPNFNAEIVQQTSDEYHKRGEFSATGYMGGFVFTQTPYYNNDGVDIQLPWGSVGLDIPSMASQMIQVIDATPTTQHTILVLTNLRVDQDTSILQNVTHTLQAQYSDSNKTIVSLSIDYEAQDEITSPSLDKQANGQSFTQKNATYRTLYSYLSTKSVEEISDIATIIIPQDEQISHILKAWADTHPNIAIPSIIGIGGSPEAKHAIDNKQMRMTFEIDFHAYVNKIMSIASSVHQEATTYVFTDEMIGDISKRKNFTTTPSTVPIVSIERLQLNEL